MFTMVAQSTRKTVSAVAAITIVGASALVMDQAHVAAAPRGIVEVGELQPVETMPIASLPEVVVVAERNPATFAAVTTWLPEVVVIAKRVAKLVAKEGGKKHPSPAINAGL